MQIRRIAATLAASAVVLASSGCALGESVPTAPAAAEPKPPADSQFVTPPKNFVGIWHFCVNGIRVFETADPAGSENTSQITSQIDPTCNATVAR